MSEATKQFNAEEFKRKFGSLAECKEAVQEVKAEARGECRFQNERPRRNKEQP